MGILKATNRTPHTICEHCGWRRGRPGCGLRACRSGYRVDLFERRTYLGGRASSYEHAGTGEVIDNCQHVLVGCCANLIDLYRRIGAEDKIRWFDRITFLEPGGIRSALTPSVLPAPLQRLAFLKAHAFSTAISWQLRAE